MGKKMKMLALALGVSAIMVGSFATAAIAAGPAGYGNGTQECVQDVECLQDASLDQLQDRVQLRELAQDCDVAVDAIQDRIQLRDCSEDCDVTTDPIQDRIQQRDQLRDPTAH